MLELLLLLLLRTIPNLPHRGHVFAEDRTGNGATKMEGELVQ